MANGETDLGPRRYASMDRRVLVAANAALLVLALSVSSVVAGEITGNGKNLKTPSGGLHGRSECAYSGQEDLQFLDDTGAPLAQPHKGVPGHAQSWGQIPKADRDFLTSIGLNPGLSCNPTKAGGGA
jgi:hypothetical protein